MENAAVCSDSLGRFVRRQSVIYNRALHELETGEKTGFWMPYIFPQLRSMAKNRKMFVFGLTDVAEARMYCNHPLLGHRLRVCCKALLKHTDKTATDIFGDADSAKLHSSITVFASVSEEGSVFHRVLEQFFSGQADACTIGYLSGKIVSVACRKY